ncbi:MAG: type I polyketide synthase [Candidatus Poribacteria bacterium]|nr:type I polyketide synthase [Candidatus Poribacteria bacterium]
MMPEIAIVGMACEYPDARNPLELWENVLALRRAFRRMPQSRLRLEDYLSTDRDAPDSTYIAQASLIEGYEFDRVRFRVSGSTFREADMAHWLALDVATKALADAGFPEGKSLPREATGVLLGNTLTGEFSRADALRLRWPYVRRVVESLLIEEGKDPMQRRAFLEELETQYKAPFPSVGSETLAGSLSNTIAGRICNYFDLKGGGYTVDGACSSSLLAVANACSALVAGDLDVALAGGVDLSLDPFELVGFAKTGALTSREMRVYDTRSDGFWPGEGCGFVVLMRHQDAVAQDCRIYAVIRGWGISSDGSGGITRPKVEGQLLAIRRAYRRAGFGVETVPYFEGHGTGTSVGDTTELQTLSRARREVSSTASPAFISSIKANIGHTKAAAGVAGLIKATMALYTQLLPPTTGCSNPHPMLTEKSSVLRVLPKGKLWQEDQLLRAGVSAMGFGGINTHLVLEGGSVLRRKKLNARERMLLSTAQDTELFLFSAPDIYNLRQQIEHLLTFAQKLSFSEMTDLGSELERRLDEGVIRAAIIAKSPEMLVSRLDMLRTWLTEEAQTRIDSDSGVFLGMGKMVPRLAFLFPGQGAPVRLDPGIWGHRFNFVRELYDQVTLLAEGDAETTKVAQPAIVTASLSGLRILEALDITASVAIGHSLGELTALHWASVIDAEALQRVATLRGQVMEELSKKNGAMASIEAGETDVKELLLDFYKKSGQKKKVEKNPRDCVAIAGLNSFRQTVISGEATAVAQIIKRAREKGLKVVNLPVSHAFHSPLVEAAAPLLSEHLASEDFRPLQRTVLSTVTGAPLMPDTDIAELLCHQVTEPVRFTSALTRVGDVDLFIEVGPGHVLSGLIRDQVETPVVSLDTCGRSLTGLLGVVGAAFVLGVKVNHKVLFADRFTCPFPLNWQPRFFVNPCELAPLPETVAPMGGALPVQNQSQETEAIASLPRPKTMPEGDTHLSPTTHHPSTTELIRQLVAQRAELPLSAVKDNNRLLSDLHLNSISVSQLVTEAHRHLDLPPPVAPTEYADATVASVAQALEEQKHTGATPGTPVIEQLPAGVDTWVRPFTVEYVERALPNSKQPQDVSTWKVIAPTDYPFAQTLQEVFARLEWGGGIIVCLPSNPSEDHINYLLEGSRAILREAEFTRFVLLQHGGGAAAFARTLHLEVLTDPTMQKARFSTCVIDIPQDHPRAIEWVIAEVRAASGYTEAHYDTNGTRREPVLRLLDVAHGSSTTNFLDTEDVLLVTGGGKGITSECAFSLSKETGVSLAIMGRSDPETDAVLAANLSRMEAAKINFCYLQADVTEAESVQSAIQKAEAELGPITGILHGAGVNVPQRLLSLDEAAFQRTLAPKIKGLRNVLAAVNSSRLRLLLTFSSIIALTGMQGEADYALANEWLTSLTEEFQAHHPNCLCLAVKWSVWSGIGMGERLGSIDALVQQGITPITPDEGIRLLHHLMNQYGQSDASSRPVAVVVTGRFGEPPTLKMEKTELPFLRFLEYPRVFYPGVEIVLDAELSCGTDPYLLDHVFQGERLFPAVMGLEAMAQAVMALMGTKNLPIFENVQFARPVVVSANNPITIRLAALVKEDSLIEVVLRSEETDFQVDYFRATCRLKSTHEKSESTKRLPEESKDKNRVTSVEDLPSVPIDPKHSLYGGILFQGERFQRLCGYRRLMARECLAEVALSDTVSWFSKYLPQTLVMSDPGVRDATIHAIQVCVPHATLLPIGIERLYSSTDQILGNAFLHAYERSHEGDIFTYDVKVTGVDGQLLEQWDGLRLKVVDFPPVDVWVESLLGPYIERRVRELVSTSLAAVVVERSPKIERQQQSNQAIQRALGKKVSVWRRPDGKPFVSGDFEVSVAHADDLTLAVIGSGPLGCDIEPVAARPSSVWRDILGPDRFSLAKVVARETEEDLAFAATRVWTVSECLKKASARRDAPLVLHAATPDGWILFRSGQLVTATFVAPVRGTEEPLTLAVLV